MLFKLNRELITLLNPYEEILYSALDRTFVINCFNGLEKRCYIYITNDNVDVDFTLYESISDAF